MIIDVLWIAVSAILTPLFNALPTFSLISTIGLPSTGVAGGSTSIGTEIGNYLASMNALMPIHEIIDMVRLCMAAILAFFVTYKVANWIWRHIPDLWGFGPGSG